MNFGTLLTNAIEEAVESKRAVEQANRKLTASNDALAKSLANELEVTNKVTDLREKNNKLSKLGLQALGDVATAHYEFIKSIEMNAKTLVRGTTLLAKNKDEQRANLNMMEASAVAYKKALGASERDSMALIASYQSTYKLVNGQFDKGADEYLKTLGNVGRILGASVEDMGFLQNDVLTRKGKFSKDFSEEVLLMMADAGSKVGLNMREATEALDDTLNKTLMLDQAGRMKAAKMALEGAALSKKAAVDFGKYADSLVGARGVDALKGMAKLSALTGESIESIDEKRRSYERNKNDTRYLDVQNQGAAKLLGSDDLLKSYDKAGAVDKVQMEQVLTSVLGLSLDNVVENQRVRKDIKNPNEKFGQDISKDIVGEMSKSVQNWEESRKRGEGAAQELMLKTEDAAGGPVKNNLNTAQELIGFSDGLGTTKVALQLFEAAVHAITARLLGGQLMDFLGKRRGKGKGRGRGGRGGRGARGAANAAEAATKTTRAGRGAATAAEAAAGVGKATAGGAAAAGRGAATAAEAAAGAGKLARVGKAAKTVGKFAGPAALLLDAANTGIDLSTTEGRDGIRKEAESVTLGGNLMGMVEHPIDNLLLRNPLNDLAQIGLTSSDAWDSHNAAKESEESYKLAKERMDKRPMLIDQGIKAVMEGAKRMNLDVSDAKKVRQLVSRTVTKGVSPLTVLDKLGPALDPAPTWTSDPVTPSPIPDSLRNNGNSGPVTKVTETDRATADALQVQKKILSAIGRNYNPVVVQLSI